MNKPTTIYFDLDGTVYPLYTQPLWLERITTLADPTAYAAEETIPDAAEFIDLLIDLVDAGYTIGVTSWCALGSSPEYDKAVRAEKRAWIKKFLPVATEIHIVRYGTPKHRTVSDPSGILVDDKPEEVGWKGRVVHADNMMNELKGLVN